MRRFSLDNSKGQSKFGILATYPMNTAELELIRPKELCRLLGGIHLSTLYRWEAEGKIPIDKIKFGPRAVGYRKSDYLAWINGELEDEPQTERA